MSAFFETTREKLLTGFFPCFIFALVLQTTEFILIFALRCHSAKLNE